LNSFELKSEQKKKEVFSWLHFSGESGSPDCHFQWRLFSRQRHLKNAHPLKNFTKGTYRPEEALAGADFSPAAAAAPKSPKGGTMKKTSQDEGKG